MSANNQKKTIPSVHDIAQDIVDNVLKIQTSCSQWQEVERVANIIQRQARQLLLTDATRNGVVSWSDGLEAMVSRIERGDAPSAKELERHLLLLDVAAAKIRNFRRARIEQRAA